MLPDTMQSPSNPRNSLQAFKPPLKTGYVYDVRMRFHEPIITKEERGNDSHPEDPRRIFWIYDMLDVSGCLVQMKPIKVLRASEKAILRVHSKEYLKTIVATSQMETHQLLAQQELFDSIYLNTETYFCSLLSAGALIELSVAVAKGEVKDGIAIIRPPGHHSCATQAMGFCIFNNVAIAARELLDQNLAKRILIVDWDVHHGNGIQEAFREDPNVLYISIHRWENGKFYPEFSEGGVEYVGEGKGVGNMGDADYLYAFQKVVLPAAKEFDPDFIMVASGFDAAAGDPLGQCYVTPACYAYMTRSLKALARGKVVLSLEGGYNLDAVANSALGCVKALMQVDWNEGIVSTPARTTGYAVVPEYVLLGKDYKPEPVPTDMTTKLPSIKSAMPSEKCIETVELVRKTHAPYWACFNENTA
ncbi:Histone deacetylase hda1 [Mycoemilia scoparia]|uniref:histone deacetylase n=1 Tax=Mycoemilia scoparia TaxID=417184 RepID=A0A9W8A3N4_9FUNG|nr:Histone deacetylase hda1 [Mycoemilia scoparia]